MRARQGVGPHLGSLSSLSLLSPSDFIISIKINIIKLNGPIKLKLIKIHAYDQQTNNQTNEYFIQRQHNIRPNDMEA